MVKFETRSFFSELQRQLDAASGTACATATMEVFAGEDVLQISETEKDAKGLCFGPYGYSPLSGLHFDAADDSTAS